MKWIRMCKINQYNNNLIEVFENTFLSKNNISNQNEKYKRISAFVLLYKSYILYRNLIELLDRHQVQSGAYLSRGILEIRADLTFLLANDENTSKLFIETADIIRNTRTGLLNNLNKKFPSAKVKQWTNGVTIEQRIKMLGNKEVFTYALLCSYAHSSFAAYDDIHRNETHLIVKEQLFIATHNFLESCRKYSSYFGLISINIYDSLFENFIKVYRNSKQ